MDTQIIKFQNAELIAVQNDESIYVAVKPICEAIGLDYISAYKSLKNDELLSELLSIQTTTGADFKQYEMVCIPIQMLSAWLFNIQIGKVKEDVRPALTQFKRECANVLFQHFFGVTKIISENVRKQYEIRKEMKNVNREISKLLNHHKQLQQELERVTIGNFTQLGLEFEEKQEVPKTAFHLN